MLEQLEQKILNTVSALQEARKDNKALQETNEELNNTIAELRQAVSDAEQRLQHRDTAITALQQQYESVKRENSRLSQEKNEWEVKVWYCDGQSTGFVAGPNFTTLAACPNVGNLQVYGASPTKATFTWDASNGVYSFVRLKARVDSISNPTDPDWFQIGGMGVAYGTNTKNKNGLTPGETYRGQARTWCDPNGGAYNSLSWTPLVTWTQPTVRLEGGETIKNLSIYPNPSRDIFNITFTSEAVQDLRVRVLNVVGEEIILEDLQQFVGEYTKQINLQDNAKGIYFLEIETDDGVINKKLILQ